MTDPAQRPLLIELPEAPPPAPEAAPPVPDAAPPVPDAGVETALQRAARAAARPPALLGRLFWGLGGAILLTALSLAAWDWAAGLLARLPLLGAAVSVLLAAFALVLLVLVLRELAALGRLARLDGLRRAAEGATDLPAARAVAARLDALYAGRAELAPGRERLAALAGEQFDAPALLDLAEEALLAPLDARAEAEVAAAARQVATITALVPLPLADVGAALAANLRMIRALSEIYGGRSGTLGSWRLVRAVLAHLVATGAIAVGDDLIGSALGGGLLAKLSRRFGEGVINAALTARVGVAAMEVCRPLPFRRRPRPAVSALLRRAVAGLLGEGGGGAG